MRPRPRSLILASSLHPHHRPRLSHDEILLGFAGGVNCLSSPSTRFLLAASLIITTAAFPASCTQHRAPVSQPARPAAAPASPPQPPTAAGIAAPAPAQPAGKALPAR